MIDPTVRINIPLAKSGSRLLGGGPVLSRIAEGSGVYQAGPVSRCDRVKRLAPRTGRSTSRRRFLAFTSVFRSCRELLRTADWALYGLASWKTHRDED